MIQFACPGCQKPYKVPDEFAGRQTKCRHCGQSLQVPGRTPSSQATPSVKPSATNPQLGPGGFRVRTVQSTMKVPGEKGFGGVTIPASCAYRDIVRSFDQHGRELGCGPSPYVGMCQCSYQASFARKAIGCAVGLGTTLLGGAILIVVLAHAPAGPAVVGAGSAAIVVCVLGLVAFYTITFRRTVKTQAGVALPTVEKYALMHRRGTLLTLVPLVVQKKRSFACDRVIEIDLERVAAQAQNMFDACIRFFPDAPPLLLSVIEEGQGMPPEVAAVLRLQSTTADATPSLGVQSKSGTS